MKNSTLFSRTLIALFLSLTSIAASANETSNPWISNACSAPEYDSSMLRGEEKGIVKLRFITDSIGNVVDAKIEESSGYAKLDRASMAALKNCRFTAASNNDNINTSNAANSPENKASRLISFTWAIK